MTSRPSASIDVSVIVPVRDDPRLETCLDALFAQSFPAERREIIVVDNGSRQLPDLSRFPGVRLESESRPGSYVSRNRGVAVARGRYIAFTDSDCVPDPTWLESAIHALESAPNLAAAAGPIRLFFARGVPTSVSEAIEAVEGFPQEAYVRRRGFGATANLVVRRSVFDVIGAFDENAVSGGDKEFGSRMVGAGLQLDFAPNAIVRHPARGRLIDLLRKTRRTTRGIHRLDHLEHRNWRGFGLFVYYQLKSAARTPLVAATSPALPSARSRVSYLIGAPIVRGVCLLETFRCEMRYRLSGPPRTRVIPSASSSDMMTERDGA